MPAFSDAARFAVAVAGLLAQRCSAARMTDSSAEVSLDENATQVFDRALLADYIGAWEDYVLAAKTAAPFGLQDECVPTRFESDPPSIYKGVVVLFHGFTACPQQWHEIGKLLAKSGFEVLMPLTPGHGNKVPPPEHAVKGKCSKVLPCDYPENPLDDITGLPETQQGYVNFVTMINNIVMLAPQTQEGHMVSGLSLGGALAANAGQAVKNGAALYRRQLIMNPMFKPAKKTDGFALTALNFFGFGPSTDRWMGWGEGCRKERSLGRGGICTFKVKHAAAANDFGANTLQFIKLPRDAMVSVWYDRGDPVTDTESARKLATQYSAMSSSTVYTCALPFTQHSMLSMYDDAGTNKWFLPKLSCAVVMNLAYSAKMPTLSGKKDKDEDNAPICNLGCDEKTCPAYIHQAVGDVQPLQC